MLADDLRSKPAETAASLAERALAALRERHERWRRWERKCRNDWYLEAQFRRTSVPPYSCNYMRSTIEVIMGYMMDYPPTRTVVPVEGGDSLTAQLLQTVFDLETAPYADLIWEPLEDALMFDAGFFKTGYDADARRIVIQAVSPFSVLPDPDAGSWEECSYVVHRSYGVPRDWVEHRYGVKVGEASERDPRTDKRRTGDSVDVDELWLYDYSESTWLRCVCTGRTLLEEPSENPYKHGELPITPVYDIPPRFGTWGIGESEMIEPLQDLADALDRQIYRVIKKTANRIRLVGQGAGIQASQFDDEPGSYDVWDPTKIRWDEPPPFPSELIAYRNLIEHYIQVVTGIFDVTAGQTPQRVTAASAIAVLQDAGLRRVNKKQKGFERALKRVYRQTLYNILQFYSVDTWQRILGDGARVIGDYPPEVKLLPEEHRRAYKERLGVALVLSEVDPRYDVMVTTDSALPASRAQRARLALELASLGRIDTESLLEFLDWPNRSEVLARLRQEGASGATPMKRESYPNMLNQFNPLEAMGMASPAEAV